MKARIERNFFKKYFRFNRKRKRRWFKIITIEQFEEEIKKIKKLRTKINDLKHFNNALVKSIDVQLYYIPSGCSETSRTTLSGPYVRIACEEKLKALIKEYDKYIENLKKHGLDIRNEFKEELKNEKIYEF